MKPSFKQYLEEQHIQFIYFGEKNNLYTTIKKTKINKNKKQKDHEPKPLETLNTMLVHSSIN